MRVVAQVYCNGGRLDVPADTPANRIRGIVIVFDVDPTANVYRLRLPRVLLAGGGSLWLNPSHVE